MHMDMDIDSLQVNNNSVIVLVLSEVPYASMMLPFASCDILPEKEEDKRIRKEATFVSPHPGGKVSVVQILLFHNSPQGSFFSFFFRFSHSRFLQIYRNDAFSPSFSFIWELRRLREIISFFPFGAITHTCINAFFFFCECLAAAHAI